MVLSAIKQMEELANKMPGVISLSQGIPSSSSDFLIRDFVIKALQQDARIDKYSAVAGLPELRQLISKHLKKEDKVYRAENEIIVTAGAMQALSATIFALTKPGDEMVIFSPTYSYYERLAKLASVKVKKYVLDAGNNWKIDMNKLKKLLTKKTKLLIVCNPNNPTGSVLSKEELQQINLLAYTYGFTIISDDVYKSLYYGEGKVPTLSDEDTFRKHTVSVVSLSKDYSLTGWRVGYLYGDKSLVSKILQTHDVLINCAPVISQYAAIAALQNSEKIISHSQEKYKEHRKLMGEELDQLKDYVDFNYPLGSYYFFPKIKGLTNSASFCMDLLHRAKLSVVPGSEFGEGGEEHIRLCFGKSKSEIMEGMNRLKEYFLYNTFIQV